MSLSDKRQAFVDEYCKNGYNATQAYKAAYPNCKGGWDKLGPRLMGKDGIKQAIMAKRAKEQAKIDYNYNIAMEELNEVIANLRAQAKGGNIQANQALTGAIREKNDISGLHKQAIRQEIVTPRLSDSDRQALDEPARIYKLNRANRA